MTNQTAAQANTYAETIAKLKRDIETHATQLKSSPQWAELEKIYRALGAIEELAGVRKTTLEELLGLTPSDAIAGESIPPAKSFQLVLGEQQESEVAAEIEKGS